MATAASRGEVKSPTSYRAGRWRRTLNSVSSANTSNRQKFANVANLLVTFHRCFLQFLPGFALRIESDVTYSKQTTADFLPGAPTTCQPHSVFSKIAHSIPSPLVICSTSNPPKRCAMLARELRSAAPTMPPNTEENVNAAKVSALHLGLNDLHRLGRANAPGSIQPSDFAHSGRHPSPHKASPLPHRDAHKTRPSYPLLSKVDSWRTWPEWPHRKP